VLILLIPITGAIGHEKKARAYGENSSPKVRASLLSPSFFVCYSEPKIDTDELFPFRPCITSPEPTTSSISPSDIERTTSKLLSTSTSHFPSIGSS
jgi:hypothetical protein